MLRLSAILAGLILAVMAAQPASAATIATFELDGITFDDGGTASGTFSLDVTNHTIQSVAITTSTEGAFFFGPSYDGFFLDTYLSSPTDTTLFFGDPVLFPIAGYLLSLQFSLNDSTDLSTLPTFVAAGGEAALAIFCGLCGIRGIESGSINTVSVVAATPIPGALPLLATALGGLGFVGWRRKRQAI